MTSYHPPLILALDQAAARQIQQPKTITKLSIFARSTPFQIQLPALQRMPAQQQLHSFRGRESHGASTSTDERGKS